MTSKIWVLTEFVVTGYNCECDVKFCFRWSDPVKTISISTPKDFSISCENFRRLSRFVCTRWIFELGGFSKRRNIHILRFSVLLNLAASLWNYQRVSGSCQVVYDDVICNLKFPEYPLVDRIISWQGGTQYLLFVC